MSSAENLIAHFEFKRLHNQDQGGKRIILEGTISGEPALLIAERGNFDIDPGYLTSFSKLVTHVENLGHNDVYNWYLANSVPQISPAQHAPPDLKIDLFYPATEKHFKKYAFQQYRSVTETPEIYQKYVRRYMERSREGGRLDWMFNIIEGRAEQENVLFRSQESNPIDNFLLLPDLNWDRKTATDMHLLAIVTRRDIWSLRDLKKKHLPWLKHFRSTLVSKITSLHPAVEEDLLKFYVHYHPTYYHFHLHVVHTNVDPATTQAVGKARDFDALISELETMEGVQEAGLADVALRCTVGEATDLWTDVFLPLKEGREPRA
ncbi:HIT-like protein [Teratosphaeria nubilosa]|uniref:HIT-like protein n=1 Tax=Teratosphaeria nubilosa TaxID=161662 RepID=A0A6G1LIG4_9PEZI|nr:HIT-like protein [Teratosphaeria nubilosa]